MRAIRTLPGWLGFAVPPSGRKDIVSLLYVWLDRRAQRVALAKLDARLLDDIGVNETARKREISKPFWVG